MLNHVTLKALSVHVSLSPGMLTFYIAAEEFRRSQFILLPNSPRYQARTVLTIDINISSPYAFLHAREPLD